MPTGPRVDLDANLVAELHELVDGRRPIDVRRDQQRPLAVLAERTASFAAVVVLPDPCRPTSMRTDGFASRRSR